MFALATVALGALFLQVAAPEAGVAGAAVDVVSSLGIAALVNIVVEAFGGFIPRPKFKPPIAVALGVGFAMAAFATIDGAYPNALSAVGVGITAGAAASGLDAWRSTYRGA